MYLYNTTFAVSEKIASEWLKAMKDNYLSNLQFEPSIANIRFCQIVMEPQEGYISYTFQFEIESLKAIRSWKQCQEKELLHTLRNKYGEGVLTFSTIMEIL